MQLTYRLLMMGIMGLGAVLGDNLTFHDEMAHNSSEMPMQTVKNMSIDTFIANTVKNSIFQLMGLGAGLKDNIVTFYEETAHNSSEMPMQTMKNTSIDTTTANTVKNETFDSSDTNKTKVINITNNLHIGKLITTTVNNYYENNNITLAGKQDCNCRCLKGESSPVEERKGQFSMVFSFDDICANPKRGGEIKFQQRNCLVSIDFDKMAEYAEKLNKGATVCADPKAQKLW